MNEAYRYFILYGRDFLISNVVFALNGGWGDV